MSVKSWDEKSEELARYFLAGDPPPHEHEVRDLAAAIQTCIDDWIESHSASSYDIGPRTEALRGSDG